MGLNLEIVSNHPAILASAHRAFGGFGPGQTDTPPDLVFHLFGHEVDDGSPGRPVFRLHQSLLYQTTGRDSTLVANLITGQAFGYFSPTTLANPAYFRWHFLELAFFMMLEWRGWMGVHGSALVKAGRAMLLRAQSGGGKTILAYAGARRNLRALAEDVVWLDEPGRRWWGMPWHFHLLPDAKRLFPELAGYEPALQINGEMKLEVNLETIRPGSTTVSAQPAVIVLVERCPGKRSRLEPLSAQAVQIGWPAGATGLEMQLPHHQSQIMALLQHPAYRLYFGDDIEAAVDLLNSLLS
jgi:hypothetical protein